MLAALLLLATTGCQSAGAVSKDELNRIADKCGLERSALKSTDAGWVYFQPDQSAKIEAVNCGLTELKRIPDLKLGFVGKERYGDDSK